MRYYFYLVLLFVGLNTSAEDHPFPVGMFAAFSTDTIPTVFVEYDGSLLDRNEYAEIFVVICTVYGTPKVDDFKLLDYHGQFLRGWNNGSGIDSDAAIRTDRGDGTQGDSVGTKQAGESQEHSHFLGGSCVRNTGDSRMLYEGYDSSSSFSSNRSSSATGGSETRPKNISVVWCIRYQLSAGIGNSLGTNIFIGATSGSSMLDGSGNLIIGHVSGVMDGIGSNNVFLGFNSDSNETWSDKLYIENSDSLLPLIYGDFAAGQVQVNGEFRATGCILTTEVNIKLQSNWQDYVFDENYKLLTLRELSQHIQKHKHLPGIPLAKKIAEDGLPMGAVVTKQMDKIEELTLYILQLKEENDQLKKENAENKQSLNSTLKRLDKIGKVRV